MERGPTCFFEISIGGRPAGRVVLALFDDKAPQQCARFRTLCAESSAAARHLRGSRSRTCNVCIRHHGGDRIQRRRRQHQTTLTRRRSTLEIWLYVCVWRERERERERERARVLLWTLVWFTRRLFGAAVPLVRGFATPSRRARLSDRGRRARRRLPASSAKILPQKATMPIPLLRLLARVCVCVCVCVVR